MEEVFVPLAHRLLRLLPASEHANFALLGRQCFHAYEQTVRSAEFQAEGFRRMRGYFLEEFLRAGKKKARSVPEEFRSAVRLMQQWKASAKGGEGGARLSCSASLFTMPRGLLS